MDVMPEKDFESGVLNDVAAPNDLRTMSHWRRLNPSQTKSFGGVCAGKSFTRAK